MSAEEYSLDVCSRIFTKCQLYDIHYMSALGYSLYVSSRFVTQCLL